MSEFKKLFYCEDDSKRALWRYFLFITAVVALIISEIDPVIANDILMILELIFIIRYFQNSSLKEELPEIYSRNKVGFALFGFWALSTLVSLLGSPRPRF